MRDAEAEFLGKLIKAILVISGLVVSITSAIGWAYSTFVTQKVHDATYGQLEQHLQNLEMKMDRLTGVVLRDAEESRPRAVRVRNQGE